MKLKLVVFCCIMISIVIFSCSTPGKVITQQDAEINKLLLKEKIICINPEVIFFKDAYLEKHDFIETLRFENKIEKEIGRWSKKIDANYVVYSFNDSTIQIDTALKLLTPLKTAILSALEIQNSNISTTQGSILINDEKYFYPHTINIPLIWSEFEQIFKTRFFASFVIYSRKNKCYSAHFIADVVTGKLLFQEIRVYKSRLTKDAISILVFDSFYTLKDRLK